MNTPNDSAVALLPPLTGSASAIDWPKCQRGEKRWDDYCAKTHPGKTLMTPKTDTLESMADCSKREFSRLASKEVKANRKYWQNS